MISIHGTKTSLRQARHRSNRNDVRGGNRALQASEKYKTIPLGKESGIIRHSKRELKQALRL